MDPDIADAADQLRSDRSVSFDVSERTIRLLDPVNGDPGFAVLRVLGEAQDASPVGAASHGPGRVAAGVWRAPELYLARWTNGKRWVVGYRLPGDAKPNDYVRMEGRIPTRLEIDNWYAAVPPTVDEAFLDAGVLLDDPPFPVPPPAPVTPPRAPAKAAARPRATSAPRAPRAAKPPAAPKRDKAPATRLCAVCRMQKSLSQFVPGSDVCVDCRS
ncbi:MAG TPA: hypothetical protein VHT97_09255 [Acidimicrobiales bacterium]|nr:hypothetical protein [Acidimicrobiales bacterium]